MGQSNATIERLADLKASIAHVGRAEKPGHATLPFGVQAIDGRLPGGGLPLGVLHEVTSGGPDIEHGAAAALLTAGIVARQPGPVLWVMERLDLFAPGLHAFGLSPDRVIYVEAEKPKIVLLVMEEGLRHVGLAAVVGEVSGPMSLSVGRRLQLAAEQSGVTCFALRRSRSHDPATLAEPTAAVTRWRVSALPSPPPLAHAPDTPGLGRPRWRLDLLRCRGGESASWIVEASDATGHLGLPADLADRPAPAVFQRQRAASGSATGDRAA